MKVQATVQELLPTGSYKARIKGIELTQGQYGDQLKWTFEVMDEDYGGQTLSAWTSLNTSTTSKLVLWAAAALNETADEDLVFDTDDLKGKVVSVTVIEKTGKDGKVFNKVDDVRPFRKPKDKAKAKPKSAEDDDEAGVAPVDDPFDKD